MGGLREAAGGGVGRAGSTKCTKVLVLAVTAELLSTGRGHGLLALQAGWTGEAHLGQTSLGPWPLACVGGGYQQSWGDSSIT
jgi:hypothetical protein